MRRLLTVPLMVIVAVHVVTPAGAARRDASRGGRRAVVAVHSGWPLRRPNPAAVIHPVRSAVRVESAAFLPPAVFASAALAAESTPTRDVIAWEDGETLDRSDDWTEFTLNCDRRGKALWLEVSLGKLQTEWAEVVFADGEAQIVDFAQKTSAPGLYSLLTFKQGRGVDHVRMLARARSAEAKVVLRMRKE